MSFIYVLTTHINYFQNLLEPEKQKNSQKYCTFFNLLLILTPFAFLI